MLNPLDAAAKVRDLAERLSMSRIAPIQERLERMDAVRQAMFDLAEEWSARAADPPADRGRLVPHHGSGGIVVELRNGRPNRRREV